MSRPMLGLTGFTVIAMLVGGSLTYGRGVGGRGGGGGFASRGVARSSVNSVGSVNRSRSPPDKSHQGGTQI